MHDRSNQLIGDVVILGGGTAGWMTAAALAKKVLPAGVSVTLIESDAIGTVGVGEATLPNLRYFNQMLGIDEKEMMLRTAATFKLGIQFRDWGKIGDHYMHPFGRYGESIERVDFHHYWARQNLDGRYHDFGECCFPVLASRNNRFAFPLDNSKSPLFDYSYAFQFDASLYAAYLATYSKKRGVNRIEGKVTAVKTHDQDGSITSVILERGEEFSADLFIDCSGFRGLLIEQTLKTGYESWNHYLPNNRAIAVPCEIAEDIGPYTCATARSAGWQWRIPLQHRIGNGYVYWSDFISDQEALDDLLQSLEGAPLAEPKQLMFNTGRRRKLWNENCVAIGLSGGFLEPLESTSIDLIQTGIENLIKLFPSTKINNSDRDEYNRLMDREFERIRDFLILHYVGNQREDPMWVYYQKMERPDSLNTKIEAFRRRGLVPEYTDGLFLASSWLSVLIGQNIYPEAYDPRVDRLSGDEIATRLGAICNTISGSVEKTHNHLDFIAAYGAGFSHKIETIKSANAKKTYPQ